MTTLVHYLSRLVFCRASIFLEEVFQQTNIAPHNQEYLFEGHLYELDPNLQAHNFSRTTEHCPLIMLSREPEDPVGIRYRDRECG